MKTGRRKKITHEKDYVDEKARDLLEEIKEIIKGKSPYFIIAGIPGLAPTVASSGFDTIELLGLTELAKQGILNGMYEDLTEELN